MAATDERSSEKLLIRATLTRDEHGEDACTLHPENPPDDRQLTAWITAKQGSFVSLGDWR